MSTDEKLKILKEAWVRQITEYLGDIPMAEKCVAMASINGLFDQAQELFFLEELASDSRYSAELIGLRVINSIVERGLSRS